MSQTALKNTSTVSVRCVVSKGPHKGQSFTFNKEKIVIGRGAENDVVLMNDPLVSRVHCQLLVIGHEIEVQNLSQKNTVIVEGESVQKWKLLDRSFFSIGDSEITLELDLGERVIKQPEQVNPLPEENISIQPSSKPLGKIEDSEKTNVISMKNVSLAKPVSRKQVVPPATQTMPLAQPTNSTSVAYNPASHPKHQAFPIRDTHKPAAKEQPIAFYIVVVIVIASAFVLLREPKKSMTAEKQRKTTTLKYEDEVAIRLNSKSEKEREAELRKKWDQKNSPMALRAQENFIKGMREFQQGQFSRAQEFFQVTLNLHPGHEMASKYLKLARIRFDEVLKAKLMLGESSYQKHNFGMCASQYQQVMNMLEGRNRDETYQLAENMYQKCLYALQGIR